MDWTKVEFKDEKRYLSNMFECPVTFSGTDKLKRKFPEVKFDDNTYPSSEHLYQALKTESQEWSDELLSIEDPHKTKTLARKKLTTVPNLIDNTYLIREDFHQIKVKLMFLVVYLKFTQNPVLAQQLMDTSNEELIEKNYWNDTFWGTCDDIGENNLGIILMQLREIFQTNSSKKTK